MEQKKHRKMLINRSSVNATPRPIANAVNFWEPSTIWEPTATTKFDAEGLEVEPTATTRFDPVGLEVVPVDEADEVDEGDEVDEVVGRVSAATSRT